MTTYAEFKEYYLRSIWRTGDADLEMDLDRLVKNAESRISRDLRDGGIVARTTTAITSAFIALPGDFREMISVTLDERPLQLISPDKAAFYMQPGVRPTINGTVYWLTGGFFRMNMEDSFDVAQNLTMLYYTGITPYSTDPPANYYDKNPDFYEAAVNVQVYKYLREFELAGEHNATYASLLDSMRTASNYAMFPSGQLEMPMPVASLEHFPTINRPDNGPTDEDGKWNDNGTWG